MTAVLNVIVENGVGLDAKASSFVSLQDYLENVLWHRMELEKAGELSEDDARMVENEQSQPIRSNVRGAAGEACRRTMEQPDSGQPRQRAKKRMERTG